MFELIPTNISLKLSTYLLKASDPFLVPAVTTDQATAKVLKVFMEVYKFFSGIIAPFVAISLLVGVVLIFVGGNGKSGATKKAGVMFIISDIAALLMYFAMPFIIGFVKYLGTILNS